MPEEVPCDPMVAELDRLRDIVDRAAEALPSSRLLDNLNRAVFELGDRAALDLAEAIDGVKSASEVLAEADAGADVIEGGSLEMPDGEGPSCG